jgi:NAD(P)-dependent dehydrogenase (short-subunit alcohol dehydrogenase family)
MNLNLSGKAALVTASSSGLGKASARALAREGADVVINGRDTDRLSDAAEDIRADAESTVIEQPGDLTDPEDIEAMVKRTVEEFGGLDILVTSAGGPTPLRLLETDDEDWYHSFDLLVMSVVRLVREAAEPLSADGGGSIVNITSKSVKEASEGNVLSSSVRLGVIGLEKTLSRELAPEVRINAVLPGAHETPRIEEIFESKVERGEYDTYEEARAARAEKIPVGDIGDPQVLGDTVAYLASERANYINGTAVPIDGGQLHTTL